MNVDVSTNNYNNAANTAYMAAAAVPIKGFLCPSDSTMPPNGVQQNGYGSSSYAANVMVYYPLGPQALVVCMRDGTSNTIIIAERLMNCGTYNTSGSG